MTIHARNGALCLCLLVFWLGVTSIFAQEAAKEPPTQEPTRAQEPAAKPEQAPTQQAAPKPAPIQEQAPKPEQVPTAPPTTPRPTVVLEEEHNSPDGKLTVQPFVWQVNSRPTLRMGKDTAGTAMVLGKTQPAYGLAVSIPAGALNNIRVTGFQTKGISNSFATTDLNFYTTNYVPGDFLVSSYVLRNVNITYEYLTYPNPPENARFRFRTLWGLQGTWVRSVIDAPFKPIAIDETTGDLILNTAIGTSWFVYPTLGVGVEHEVSKHFRWEAKGSGFGFPGRSTTWNGELTVGVHFGHLEFVAGGRAFHFKTSPKRPQFNYGTLSGAYVGIQWYKR